MSLEDGFFKNWQESFENLILLFCFCFGTFCIVVLHLLPGLLLLVLKVYGILVILDLRFEI